MVLAEAPKLYPVYTWHADEVMRLDRRVFDLMIWKHTRGEDDAKLVFLRDLHKRLRSVFRKMMETSGNVAYLNQAETDLVKKTAAWMKDHPQDAGI